MQFPSTRCNETTQQENNMFTLCKSVYQKKKNAKSLLMEILILNTKYENTPGISIFTRSELSHRSSVVANENCFLIIGKWKTK
jgi:hypothetical protein